MKIIKNSIFVKSQKIDHCRGCNVLATKAPGEKIEKIDGFLMWISGGFNVNLPFCPSCYARLYKLMGIALAAGGEG